MVNFVHLSASFDTTGNIIVWFHSILSLSAPEVFISFNQLQMTVYFLLFLWILKITVDVSNNGILETKNDVGVIWIFIQSR